MTSLGVSLGTPPTQIDVRCHFPIPVQRSCLRLGAAGGAVVEPPEEVADDVAAFLAEASTKERKSAISFFISGVSFKDWLSNVVYCGVRKLARSMTKLSKEKGETKRLWWERPFEYWWGFSIKYFIPCVLWVLLVGVVKTDVDKPYGGYAAHWQAVGLVVPLLGLIGFLLHICLWVTEEPLSEAEFATDLPGEEGVGLPAEGDKVTELSKVAGGGVA